MAGLPNEFSWSRSRDACFRRCPRQYYYTYYGSWGGWERQASARTRTLYVLKQLRSRKAWAGESVHAAIHHALLAIRDGGSLFHPEALIEQTLQQMRLGWRDSGEGLYWDDPKKHLALWEHEYGIELPDAEWKAVVEHALQCLRTFFASDLYRQIAALPRAAWLDVEALATFDVAGVKVFVQLDFAHRDGDGVAIYDWKTGRADKASTREQLACYLRYAERTWDVPADRLVAREFNLATGTMHEMRLGAEALDATAERVRVAAGDLLPLHGQPEDAFSLTDDIGACKTCNFLRVCPRWIDDVV